MENVIASLQRIIKNKNFVTIVGIIVILGLLYWGYSSQINKAVRPVRVPVAKETIQPRTEITEDMVQYVEMPSISVKENVITNKSLVVGKYSNINTVIPAGSMFYTDTTIEKEKLPDSVFIKVKKGQVVYNFPVNMQNTYGNSIFPGNKIDIYMKTGNGTSEKIMLGKLVENIEVLAVKDSAGRDVFENTSQSRTPSMMIFGLPTKINLMLRKASYMNSLGVVLFPVPHGGSVSTDGATEVSTQQLVDYIEAHAVNIPIPEEDTSDELLPTISVSGNKATITYPDGCGSKYTCTYIKDNGAEKTVLKSKQTVTFTTSGTLTATLTEQDKTAHTASQDVTIDSNATNSTTQSVG